MINVLIVCSGGMSSAIVVKAIEKEGQKEGLEMHIKAVGVIEFEDELKNGSWNIALVAPQVRHTFDKFKEIANSSNIPIEVIPPQGYSPMGGATVLKQIKNLMNI